jgi:hypothetical protein
MSPFHLGLLAGIFIGIFLGFFILGIANIIKEEWLCKKANGRNQG